MELQIFLAADYANVDSAGKLNVLGAFSRIYARQFPAIHRSMYLVIKLGAELGEFGDERSLNVKLLDEDATEIWAFGGSFQIPTPTQGKKPEMNFLLEIRELEFPKQGRYEFALFVDKDKKGALPIDVEQLQPVES